LCTKWAINWNEEDNIKNGGDNEWHGGGKGMIKALKGEHKNEYKDWQQKEH